MIPITIRWTAVVAILALVQAGSGPAAVVDPPAATPEKAVARPSAAQGTWLRIETPRFIVLGEVPRARLHAIAGRLEAFRGALERLHPGSRTSPRETFVYVFQNPERGRPFTPAASGGGHPLGISQAYDLGNFVTVAAPRDDPPLEPLLHAYAHQFLDDNFPRLPLAVTEGLAEFDSGFAVPAEGALIGLANADHVQFLRDQGALPLEQLFSLDARSPLVVSENGRRAFVAGSWATMHYLVSGSGEKRPRLPAFLAALQHGESAADASRHAFGVPLDRLQQEVSEYVKGNRFLPVRVKPDPGATSTPDEDPYRERALKRDETLAALGDLIGHVMPERAADAEKYFHEALASNPNQARAHAGLGYLKYSRDQFAEAIPHFENALAVEPDAMSCYLLARSLLKTNSLAPAVGAAPGSGSDTPPWLGRARDLLARAIALRPWFAAPYVALGATHMMPDGDPRSGIAVLNQARAMLPARTDIAANLVYLMLRQGDFIGAQKLVDEALVHGGDEAALKAAREAIRTFDEHLAAKQSLRQERSPGKKAAAQAFKQAFVVDQARKVREELAHTQDPETRARLEAEIKRLEDSIEAVDGNEAAEIYNEAVDRANQRDYSKAIELLANLLPRVRDPALKKQVEDLLERFRKDAARLQQPVR
jgi:tetratricopeptide (TPR) repeat protein